MRIKEGEGKRCRAGGKYVIGSGGGRGWEGRGKGRSERGWGKRQITGRRTMRGVEGMVYWRGNGQGDGKGRG